MGKFVKGHIFRHILFWFISFLILLRIFSEEDMWNKTDCIYTFLFILSVVPAVYINLNFLMPRFWAKYQWIPYTGSILLFMVLSVLFNELIFDVLADWLFPGYYFISYYSYSEIFQFVFVILLLSTLLKLSKSWFDLQRTQKQLNELKHSQKESELNALKEQINPHFLFNGLHAIYSLTLENNVLASKMILRLSEVLRFILYETNTEKIPLQKEIQCIRDYLEIQKVRLPLDAEVKLTTDIPDKKVEIAPLLLMPLIENCFKHGVREAGKTTFIHINTSFHDPYLEFNVTNSMSPSQNDKTKGIGLSNLKRRLDLIYPKKYKLQIVENQERFVVKLKIKLL